jgi:hypothetical protein
MAPAAQTVSPVPRLKEWAYAGGFFDLTGASVSHAVSGDSAGMVITSGARHVAISLFISSGRHLATAQESFKAPGQPRAGDIIVSST